jgi:hypothetical protein
MNEAGEPAAPNGSLTQLAEPRSRLARVLAYVPRALSSQAHVLFLVGLGVYLVLLPLSGVKVSSKAELIGGNYTNVTSDVGACIAAGGTLHLIRQGRRRHRVEAERLQLTEEMHRLLHHVHADAARELGRPGARPGGPEGMPGGGGSV